LIDRPDVHVIAKWYSQVPRQPVQFKLDVDDSRTYELKDVIGNVNLEYDEDTRTYSISEETKQTLDVAVKSLRRSKAARASASLVERRQRRAEELWQEQSNMISDRQFVPGPTTRSGRQTTRRM